METDETRRRIRKSKEEIFEKVKDSIRNSRNFKKTSNSIKSPDEAVDVVSNKKKIIGNKKSSILWLAYQQGQIFEKCKANGNFIDMIKKLGISKSTILFKTSVVKFVNKYPRMKKSSLSLHF